MKNPLRSVSDSREETTEIFKNIQQIFLIKWTKIRYEA